MDEDQANLLLSENEKLRQDNDDLRLTVALVKENRDLRTTMLNSTGDLKEAAGRTTIQWQGTLDESKFRKDLQQPSFVCAHKNSSAVDLNSFMRSSMHTDTNETQPEAESWFSLEDPERFLGEIAFQLDRRILCHVFGGQTRLYGFTLPNIQDKITDVSTHPLTGKVDEGYQLQLSQRYTDLMEELTKLGYNKTLHPPFTEFVINTYGILKQRPVSHHVEYNNPDFLRKVIISTASGKLVNDLLLLLSCLSYMVKKDGEIFFLW